MKNRYTLWFLISVLITWIIIKHTLSLINILIIRNIYRKALLRDLHQLLILLNTRIGFKYFSFEKEYSFYKLMYAYSIFVSVKHTVYILSLLLYIDFLNLSNILHSLTSFNIIHVTVQISVHEKYARGIFWNYTCMPNKTFLLALQGVHELRQPIFVFL